MIRENSTKSREYPKEYKRIQTNSDKIENNRKESKRNRANLRVFGRINKNPGECERIWKNLKESEGKHENPADRKNPNIIRKEPNKFVRIRETTVDSENIPKNTKELS